MLTRDYRFRQGGGPQHDFVISIILQGRVRCSLLESVIVNGLGGEWHIKGDPMVFRANREGLSRYQQSIKGDQKISVKSFVRGLSRQNDYELKTA